jgi:uncharacterized membrane protein
MDQNTPAVLLKWLHFMGYKVKNSHILLQYLSHPESGTLLSVTDTITALGIENMAVSISFEDLPELDDAFLALLKNGSSEQLVYTTIKSETMVRLFTGDTKPTTITIDRFKNLYNGKAVLINRNASPFNQVSVLKKEIGMITVLILSFIGLFMLRSFQFSDFLYWLFAIVGFAFSILLYKVGLGASQGFLNRFCSLSSKTSCHAVLNSASAKLFPGLSFTDIGILYFSFQILSLSFSIVPTNLLYGISIVASAFVLYSIYQQAVVLKKWCPLCLCVLAILLLQSSIGFWKVRNVLTFLNGNAYVALVAVSAILFIVWQQLKPLIESNVVLESAKIELLSFKRNQNIFLQQYAKIAVLNDAEIKGVPQIILGNIAASVQLTVIANPFCKACLVAHKIIANFLEKYPISVRLVFLVPDEPGQEHKRKIASSLFHQYTIEKTRGANAIKKWYSQALFSEDNNPIALTEQEQQIYKSYLEVHYNWCVANAIIKTPSILINNKKLPPMYSANELQYHMEQLLQHEETANRVTSARNNQPMLTNQE